VFVSEGFFSEYFNENLQNPVPNFEKFGKPWRRNMKKVNPSEVKTLQIIETR
jgi:hypothetical protein